ncbi:MAG: hypothetical protein LAO78_10020 [Acidobacteriia bacterium]|nr:hypothetical protein [Terriglobia bacterium]
MWFSDKIEILEKPLGIPYSRDDEGSHSYENLRENPGALDLIPELRKARALHEFVKDLNSHPSIFQSFGCEKWINFGYSHPRVPPEYSFHSGSYVDIAFADLNACRSQQSLLELIDTYRLYGSKCIEHNMVQVMFNMRPTVNFHWGNWWTLEFWNYGLGRTEQEAEHWWAEGVRCFKQFLMERSTVLVY